MTDRIVRMSDGVVVSTTDGTSSPFDGAQDDGSDDDVTAADSSDSNS
jgi:hypothetical protein